MRRAGGGDRRGSAAAALMLVALLAGRAAAQQAKNATSAAAPSDCGALGKACCCPPADIGRNDCCPASHDLSCFKFDLGPGPEEGLCMPTDAPAGCGKENGPCCLASRANRFEVTCDDGLTCIAPETNFYRSTAQHDKLATNFQAAYRDPNVVGTCKKGSAVHCNTAFGPCGNVWCPGVDIACPKGFYCASYADATVGDRCMPLPAKAGKPGGPCLPNNFPEAPVVQFAGWSKPRAPPFCPGKNDVCFAFAGPLTLRQRSFLNIFDPPNAKKTASRIWLTQCVTVTTPCGGVGQPCCPGVPEGLTTDKPLPSYGKAWQGKPCDDTQTSEGAYCDGQWTALGGPMFGKCVANQKGCNEIGNKCCIKTSADKSERYCKAGGKRAYCVFTDNQCRLCPAVADTLLDFFVCT